MNKIYLKILTIFLLISFIGLFDILLAIYLTLWLIIVVKIHQLDKEHKL